MPDADDALLNQAPDVRQDFGRLENTFFHLWRLAEFEPETALGIVEGRRHARKPRLAFNQVSTPFEETAAWEFPPAYEEHLSLPLAVQFVTPRTLRLRLASRPGGLAARESPMLLGEVPRDETWEVSRDGDAVVYTSGAGALRVERDPFVLELRDAGGRLLTRTHHQARGSSLQNCHPLPCTVLRRAADLERRIAATFTLAPGEKLFGAGESFTRLNKRGQTLPLWTCDAHSAQTREMYKPIPFFLSDRGYGMFVHTSAPLTFDFGGSFDGANTLYLGDDELDLFIFLGTPQEILAEYTALTGRSPLPPVWSFGLWMSRITYRSEEEARSVARELREHRIPCDVIHLDTGWFEEEWRCDYRFSPSRFPDPRRLLADLREEGLRVSLWQLPYVTPANELFAEIVDRQLAVRDAEGRLPTEDAVLDFTRDTTVSWYQEKLRALLELGVSCIKADFGEAAPRRGVYASGRSGWHEHNLYPLRYNGIVYQLTRRTTGEGLIWARSAWAGSQRYPVHWGGDAENTDAGMAATLRAGLSLGLCGFTYWSHDIGGFVRPSPEELYRRWLPFGLLTSHSRCHGAPPTEPWHYSEAFLEDFRRAVELKYRLLPYVYAQAARASLQGFPLLRTLFFNYPCDPGAWTVEDAYLFGEDLLVAPLFEAEASSRPVYCPDGDDWIDYQSGELYAGGQWHLIPAGAIPCVLLVRDGAALPHIKPAPSTAALDWSALELRVFARGEKATAEVALPPDGRQRHVTLAKRDGAFRLAGDDPFDGEVTWSVTDGAGGAT